MKSKNKVLSVVITLALVLAAVCVTVNVQNGKLLKLENEHASQLENMQAEAAALNAQLQSAEEEKQLNREILIGLFHKVDYRDETVYVIGHKSPDTDTVASAVGMAYLLNSLGISAEARIPSDMNLESDYAFSALGYPVPEILENAAGKQLWLVDHSAGTQMIDGAKNARIVGIVDHHGMGDAENPEPISVLSFPAGSTCAIVFKLCEICGVELPQDIASILLTGILSDTSNMKSNTVTRLDEDAYQKLKALSGLSDPDGLFRGMKEALLSFSGMDDRDVFYADYKYYEHNGFEYGIGCVTVARTDLIPGMAERMQRIIESEIENGSEADFLLYSVYDVEYSVGYIGYIGKDAKFVDSLMENAFLEKTKRDGAFLVSVPTLSRKTEIVPFINRCLDTVK